MQDTEEHFKSGGPYKDLHVYLINGVVMPVDEADLGDDFLGTWLEGESSFLFFTVPSRERVGALLERRPELSLAEEHCFSYEEWQGTRLEPFRIGPFVIRSPWDMADAREGELGIVLDPGVVFGTGIHPTTRDCLLAMAYLHGKAPIETVLDLGTGTGVLALAAARLGANKVWSVDLNPLCVETTRRNVRLNQAEALVKVLEGRAEDFAEKPADLIVANIHYEVLKDLVEREKFRERPWLIISGLMRSQGKDIKAKLVRYGLTIVREWDGEGMWTTMLVKGAPLAEYFARPRECQNPNVK
jgi:ribosomal protein L11 methyltransferase